MRLVLIWHLSHFQAMKALVCQSLHCSLKQSIDVDKDSRLKFKPLALMDLSVIAFKVAFSLYAISPKPHNNKHKHLKITLLHTIGKNSEILTSLGVF